MEKRYIHGKTERIGTASVTILINFTLTNINRLCYKEIHENTNSKRICKNKTSDVIGFSSMYSSP